jgi:hypothetical protein
MQFPKVRILFYTLLVLISISSCKKKSGNSTQNSYKNYYDTTPGRFIEYVVTEIIHDKDASVPHDTSNYFMRIQIEDTITDNSGRINRKYVRYKKNNTNDPWQISDIWMTIIDGNNAELVEENQRVIKLKFPVNSFTNWNANIYNTSEKLDCFYENIHSSKTIGAFFFDSTVTVNQGETRNLVRFCKKNEVYAHKIGMISKYFKDLSINNFDTLNINSGKEIYMEIINFGN